MTYKKKLEQLLDFVKKSESKADQFVKEAQNDDDGDVEMMQLGRSMAFDEIKRAIKKLLS